MRAVALVFLSAYFTHAGSTKLLCSKQFCAEYIDNVGCPKSALGCVVQNATHSGTLLPSATACNCCNICLEHIHEGEYCALGEPGSPTPQAFCGPGLRCERRRQEEHPRCYPIADTECTRRRAEFDRKVTQQQVGHLQQRPQCDADGMFGPIRCVPGELCFCVDENGDRIFGEDVYSEHNLITMKCECSRLNAKFQTMLNDQQINRQTARCLDDGSFDPLQCMQDSCACVKRYYGTLDNADEADDHVQLYNSTEVQLTKIPCYDPLLHSGSGKYLHQCEASQFQLIAEIVESERNNITVLDVPTDRCEPNGWFGRMQEQQDWAFCADKLGKQIGDYRVRKSSPSGRRMNCHCGRAAILLPETTPPCCKNGNYPTIACINGECWCLNANGEQVTMQLPEDKLSELQCFESIENFCGADNDDTI